MMPLLLAAAAAATLLSPADWTQFRLNDANNAVIAGSLQTSWHIMTKGAYSSSPVIAGGVLYIGNNAGEVYAIDPASGHVKWRAQFSNPIMSQPIVAGNVVIVGEGNEDSTPSSTPSNPQHVGTGENAIIALDRATGAVRWKQLVRGSAMPTGAIIGGNFIEHNGGGDIVAFDPLTGKIQWSTHVAAISSMSAILPINGNDFATTGVAPNALMLLQAGNGKSIWSANLAGNGSGVGDCPPVTDGARLYCNYIMPPTSAVPVQTEREAVMRAYAIDLRTGKKVWDTYLERGYLPKRNEAGIPLLADGMLYMGSAISWQIHAIDPASGAVRWRFKTYAPVKGGIAEKDGVLYFGDLSGHLWAINAATGAYVGSIKTQATYNVGSPLIAGETLIIGGKNGELLAEPLATIRAGRAR